LQFGEAGGDEVLKVLGARAVTDGTRKAANTLREEIMRRRRAAPVRSGEPAPPPAILGSTLDEFGPTTNGRGSEAFQIEPLEGLEHTRRESLAAEPESPDADDDLGVLGTNGIASRRAPRRPPTPPESPDSEEGSEDYPLPYISNDESSAASPDDVSSESEGPTHDEPLPLIGGSEERELDPWENADDVDVPGGEPDPGIPLLAGSTYKAQAMVVADRNSPEGRRVDHLEPDFAAIALAVQALSTRDVDSNDPSTHYDLGVAFKEMGLLEESIAQLGAALAGGFRPMASLEVLGEILVERGDHEAAARILRLAGGIESSLDSEMIGVLYWLSRSEEALGNSTAAKRFLERVAQVDPSFRDTSVRLRGTGSAL
jgi:hypothetical protein